MTHPKVEYKMADEKSYQDEIDSWFDFTAQGDHLEDERKKAQELLNHLDHIRTVFSNKITNKRMFSK